MKSNKLVYGVGINDADYSVRKTKSYTDESGKRQFQVLWICPYYSKWSSMLNRCYSAKRQKKNPYYMGCSVCEEWLYFSNFRMWMEKQNWEGNELDKDFLVQGNKVYSPETCLFIPQRLNVFFSKGRKENNLFTGISYIEKLGKYRVRCCDGTGKMVCFGYHTDLRAAKQAWKEAKSKILMQILEEDSVQDEIKVAAFNKLANEIKETFC